MESRGHHWALPGALRRRGGWALDCSGYYWNDEVGVGMETIHLVRTYAQKEGEGLNRCAYRGRVCQGHCVRTATGLCLTLKSAI